MKRIAAVLLLFLLCLGVQAQPIQRNYFTTNVDPQLNITNGNLISTNIYVSNVFATNITANYITNLNTFNGRTTITTNLYVTNGFITYLTNNTFYTTNVTEQFVTNQLSYITNLYGPFITNNTLYSTNIYTTNLFATYVTNNTDYITNLYGPFITNDFIYTTNIFNSTAYVTNLYGPFITNFQLYSTDIFVTNLTANYITNLQDITTNLYVSNAFFTNLTVEFITNDFLFVTNLYNSNAFITNLTANYITNNTSYTTNLISSNIYTTNIFVMEASWFTNRWVGPTNDVSFTATYQNFVAAGDMEITGFQNSIATNANTSVLLLDPGGATRTLYFPETWTNFTSDGNNAYVIPKTNTAIVTLFQYGNLYTNVVVRLFGPGTGTPAPVAQVWTNFYKPSISGQEYYIVGQSNVLRVDVPTNGNAAQILGGTVEAGGVSPFNLSLLPNNSDLSLNSEKAHIESYVYDTGGGIGVPVLYMIGLGGGTTTLLLDPFADLAGVAPYLFGTIVTNGASDLTWAFQNAQTNELAIYGTGNATLSGILTANGFTDLNFAANGVVTNDSTGLLHTTPTLPVGLVSGISIGASGPAGFTWSAPVTGSGTLTATTPGLVLTNGESQATTFSNNVAIDATHALYTSNMTAVGVVTNDANGKHLTTPTLPNSLLANSSVTVNGTANHITTTSASIPLGGSATLDVGSSVALRDANNAFTTASSNYVAMTVTTSTNQNQVTPDFSVPEQLMSTNAAFTFLAPVGVDTTKTTVQWTLVNVTNTTAAAVLITSPANCHTVGTAYVTNLTAVWFQCYAQKFTNAFYIPVF